MTESAVPAVSLRHATVRRESFTFGPVSLDIPQGFVTAVVGANGSGKSTLFRLLLGLAPLAEGEAEVLGHPVAPGGDERYKARVGFLAELPHAYEGGMTAEEKARFASQWYPGWSWERYAKLMRAFQADAGIKLRRMSKGMRRKSELAVAMAHDPELLILDEPSSGLDPFAWKTLLEELNRYMERGDRTLLIATHVTEEVKRIADYILFMHRGKALGFYEKDRLYDGWRVLVVQRRTDAEPQAAPAAELRRVPGLQGMAEAGPGLFRLETNAPEEAEEACRAWGWNILAMQRMELEEVLGCLIRKEEETR